MFLLEEVQGFVCFFREFEGVLRLFGGGAQGFCWRFQGVLEAWGCEVISKKTS